MGLSAIFPVLHGLELYGIAEMQDRIGLTWLVLQGFFYILGAGLYAVSSIDPRNIWRADVSRRDGPNGHGQGLSIYGEALIKYSISLLLWPLLLTYMDYWRLSITIMEC